MNEIIERKKQYYNPAGVYLTALESEESKRTQIWALKTASGILFENEDITRAPWHAIGVPEANYLRAELHKQFKYTTANKILSAVRQVIIQAHQLEQIDADAMLRVTKALKTIKGKSDLKGRLVPENEINALLATFDDSPKGIRDRSMVYTAYCLALRRDEVGHVDMGDLDLIGSVIEVTGAKGNKTQKMYFGERAWGYLEKWVNVRGVEPGGLFCRISKNGYMGKPGEKRKGITGRGFTVVLQKAQKDSGIPALSAHDLRRSSITRVALKLDIHTAQQFARHENVETTLSYIRSANLQADLQLAAELFNGDE